MNSFSNDIEEITFLLRKDQLAIKNFIETSNGISFCFIFHTLQIEFIQKI